MSIVERQPATWAGLWIARVAAMVLGLVVGAVLVQALSPTHEDVIGETFTSLVNSTQAVSDVLELAVPLIFCAISAALAARVRMWNIGIEGQLYLGGWAATGVGLALPDAPGLLLLLLMIAAALAAGAVWALIPAVARGYAGVNEVITTLLLNFVATLWVAYWVAGRWRDGPDVGRVSARPVPVVLSTFDVGGVAVPVGLVVAVVVAVGFWALLRFTTFGYRVRITGASVRTAAYAGIPTRRLQVGVFALSGAIGGLAGVVQLVSSTQRLTTDLSNNYGYTGFAIAVIAGYSLLGVIPIGVLLGAVASSAITLQLFGADGQTVIAVSGVILLFAALGERLAGYRLRRRRPPEPAVEPAETSW